MLRISDLRFEIFKKIVGRVKREVRKTKLYHLNFKISRKSHEVEKYNIIG